MYEQVKGASKEWFINSWKFTRKGKVVSARAPKGTKPQDALESPLPLTLPWLQRRDDERYWLYRYRVYRTDGDLTGADLVALITAEGVRAARAKERKLANAHAEASGALASTRREPIAREVRYAVFERDGGACVECGATFDIQYDHIIPLAMGGSNNVENLQLLCGPCNRQKGPTLG